MSSAAMPIRTAARELGVHENTIRNWIDRRIIGFFRLPSGVRRIPVTEVERLQREMFVVRASFPDDKFATPVRAASWADDRPSQRPST